MERSLIKAHVFTTRPPYQIIITSPGHGGLVDHVITFDTMEEVEAMEEGIKKLKEEVQQART